MSICKHCSGIGGWHHFGCTAPRQERTPSPAAETRIEWTGNIQVHHPIKPATDKGVTK